jgi:hypothetical protein
VLTDNGSKFTDRFAVDKKGKPPDKPSGQHPFDQVCAQHTITHRLTRRFRPQTTDVIDKQFLCSAEASGFSVRRTVLEGVARRGGQDWPEATAAGGLVLAIASTMPGLACRVLRVQR